jgi:hypothetical protein
MSHHLILPYHSHPDSLAHLKGQPLFCAKSMRDVDVVDVVKTLKAYLPACGVVHPEAEAVTFYAGNAVWAELLKKYAPDEPLPPIALELAKSYLGSASLTAQRLLYYLILIIARESRHVHSTAYPAMAALHGSVFQDFNKYMHGASGSMNAKELFLAKPPKMKLGAFADAISWTFHNGGFNSSYGGKKWGVIADVFKGLVDGTMSPELATDVSWALCHNGGPIFNKGMTYHNYDASQIKTILDVQRSGQIPELVKSHGMLHSSFVPMEAQAMVATAELLFPGVFGTEVDWHKVEVAGSVQKYGHLKAAQPAKPLGKVFYVLPGVYVPVIERKAAA